MAAATILAAEPLIPGGIPFTIATGDAIWRKSTKTKQAACPLGAVKESRGSS